VPVVSAHFRSLFVLALLHLATADYSIRRGVAVVVTPPPIGERSIVMSLSVRLCLSVCVPYRPRPAPAAVIDT